MNGSDVENGICISGGGDIQHDTEGNLQGVSKNWMRSEQMQFQ